MNEYEEYKVNKSLKFRYSVAVYIHTVFESVSILSMSKRNRF